MSMELNFLDQGSASAFDGTRQIWRRLKPSSVHNSIIDLIYTLCLIDQDVINNIQRTCRQNAGWGQLR